MAVIEGE
jgi:hypothetical protein